MKMNDEAIANFKLSLKNKDDDVNTYTSLIRVYGTIK